MARQPAPVSCVLVANRGEIARRVIRGAHDTGCEAVAVYASDDADSPHVGEADAAVLLPGSTLGETYLDAAALVEAARRSGADALHPGYGFLSENPAPGPTQVIPASRQRSARRWLPPPACRCCRARWSPPEPRPRTWAGPRAPSGSRCS